jgi:cold-inducible RNA-binding protein
MKNLFVGNLSFQTSESDLRTLFGPFGEVVRIHLATDRETGQARGFGFVEMTDDNEAAKAIAALDGKELGGRKLRVSEARPRAQRPSGPRSGSGGGRGRGGFSNENYSEAARQPREPRW